MAVSPDAYDVVLADLRAQRERIDNAINAIEGVRGLPMQAVPNVLPIGLGASLANEDEPSLKGPYVGMTIQGATKALLAERGKPMGNPDIAAIIKKGGVAMKSQDPVNTVGAILTRRAKDVGDIVKVGRGLWGLPEWVEAADAAPLPGPVPPPSWGKPTAAPAASSPAATAWGRALSD